MTELDPSRPYVVIWVNDALPDDGTIDIRGQFSTPQEANDFTAKLLASNQTVNTDVEGPIVIFVSPS